MRSQYLRLALALASIGTCTQSALASSWRKHIYCADPVTGLFMHESSSWIIFNRHRINKKTAWDLKEARKDLTPSSTSSRTMTSQEIEAIVEGMRQMPSLATFNGEELAVQWHPDKQWPQDYRPPTYATSRRTPYWQTLTLSRLDEGFLHPLSSLNQLTSTMYCLDIYRYNR